MFILCVIGKIGSGKDEVAKYLAKRHGFFHIDLGDITRDITREYNRTPTRENLQLSQKEYREAHGRHSLAERAVKKIKEQGSEHIVVSALRIPEDAEVIKHAFGDTCLFVEVVADRAVRLTRLKARKSDRDPTTEAEFIEHERTEEEHFPSEAMKPFIQKTISNNGTLEELHKIVDRLLRDIL
ncbi:MAG: AAA family ATPase [Nanoarchaeota archaeon]|nr:AAA family ATPase [Nanoarchaeota archaeon]